jgi:glycosyltransferase involved in cell wall biosynthesis
MKIVVDLQAAQTKNHLNGVGHFTLSITKAIIQNRRSHEIVIALSSLFPETIKPLRSEFKNLLPEDNILVWKAPEPLQEKDPENIWRRNAAELIRESFLTSLKPDIIFLPSFFEGYADNTVTSIGKFSDQQITATVTHDIVLSIVQANDPHIKQTQLEQFYFNKLLNLKKTNFIIKTSQPISTETIEYTDNINQFVSDYQSDFKDLFGPNKKQTKSIFKFESHNDIKPKKGTWNKAAKKIISIFEQLKTKAAYKNSVFNPYKNHKELIKKISEIKCAAGPSKNDLFATALAIHHNENIVISQDPEYQLKWRHEGSFDSSYSLAHVNREVARSLKDLGQFVILHSYDGPGAFPPDQNFLKKNIDLEIMYKRVSDYPHEQVDVVSRNTYPPKVDDMEGKFNILHHYAWEESGFPYEWITKFNTHLDGITCQSEHVEKILIDNGVTVPLKVSGQGFDHWDKIKPETNYQIQAKDFRFLHVSSCFPRKGVDALLDAFGLNFSCDDNVSLVIKTFKNPHNEIHQWLAERKNQNDNYPDVVIIEDELSDQQIKSLYKQCHVLVAPSRAEGLGLPLAEAMLSGLPIITTAWGGQLDFCNEHNSWLVDYQFQKAETHFQLFNSAWAEPDRHALKNALEQAYKSSPDQLKAKAESGRKLLLEKFTWPSVTKHSIDTIKKWKMNNQYISPKIGWVTTWNTKCGIAAYSQHLISNMPSNITVFAPYQDSQIIPDEPNCIRNWKIGKEENHLENVTNNIADQDLNTIIIQFNYGFFNHKELCTFIERQIESGRIVIIMMHSTTDPKGIEPSWNVLLSKSQPTLKLCHRILAHSVSDLNRLKAIDLVENVSLFPHGVITYKPTTKIKQHNNTPLIAAYGFFFPHKGFLELATAISILNKSGFPTRLRLVCAQYPIPESAQTIKKLHALVIKLGIEEFVETHTDFLTDNESLSLLNDADLIVYPYQQTGESSSAAVRYGLATTRPVAVTPLDIFEDVNKAVFKLPGFTPQSIADGIVNCLNELADNTENSQHIANEADRWRNAHDYAIVGQRLHGICTALLRKANDHTNLH